MIMDDHAGPSSEVRLLLVPCSFTSSCSETQVIETESAFDEEPIRPPSKQKKADKLYARREALLASPSFRLLSPLYLAKPARRNHRRSHALLEIAHPAYEARRPPVR